MRDRILRVISLAGAFLSIAVSSAVAQGSPPDIQLGLRPTEAGAEIKVLFPADKEQSSATIPVFIGQGSSTPDRRKRTGRGGGSSGLRFDVVLPES